MSHQTAFDVSAKVFVVVHSYELLYLSQPLVAELLSRLGQDQLAGFQFTLLYAIQVLEVISPFAEPQKPFHKYNAVTTLMSSRFILIRYFCLKKGRKQDERSYNEYIRIEQISSLYPNPKMHLPSHYRLSEC